MTARAALLVAALALPLAACEVPDDEVPAVEEAPDPTAELPDPDEDDILDVDPLSRQDGQVEDELEAQDAEVGDEVLPSLGDRIGPDEADDADIDP
jgi:hypothetical protein